MNDKPGWDVDNASMRLVLLALFACGSNSLPAIDGNDAGKSCGVGGTQWPVPGELSILQLHLGNAGIPQLGEAAVIVGPTGDVVVLDVGNVAHSARVREAIRMLNREVLTPERGYPQREPLQVEAIVITHFHADHIGALESLVEGESALQMRGPIIHRGFWDVGQAANEKDVDALCEFATDQVFLCGGPRPASCRFASESDVRSNQGCPGLAEGEVRRDDVGVAYFDIGGDARIEFLAANGFVYTGESVVAASPFGHSDNNEENARSIAGRVILGDFVYHFGGDMTGPAGPDVEKHYAQTAAEHYGGQGADVIHAHHHARDSSSGPSLVSLLAPKDGRDRNVVAGISAGHVGSPDRNTVQAWIADGRLGNGRFWVTDRAIGGHEEGNTAADGDVWVTTHACGRRYGVFVPGTQAVFQTIRGID